MGKGTDKLYITHSEWASEDAYSAAAGSGVARAKATADNEFKRLPFNYCSLSLQPFNNPVCSPDGYIFDVERIAAWFETHDTNPVNSDPLNSNDLIKLNFAKNGDGEYVDPVSSKVFNDSSYIVAIKPTGNVFSGDSVDEFNVKPRMWADLVSGDSFTKKDIITLQDPKNAKSRSYLGRTPVGVAAGMKEDSQTARISNAKKAVEAARAHRKVETEESTSAAATRGNSGLNQDNKNGSKKPIPFNAARYTTGLAAASFTSTGVSPYTSNERAILSDEEFMLKPKRVKQKGYATICTNIGNLNLELYPEHAPKTVWNFLRLAQKGYYKGVGFHRNIPNFMIQGGDPTGTGKGGKSIWGKDFLDEFAGPLKHDSRGTLSMANKGKNTNSSQFFFSYRAVSHLDNKHTVFGRVVGGMDTLDKMEKIRTTDKDMPVEPIYITKIDVVADPFVEYMKQQSDDVATQREKERIRAEGGSLADKTTWTGKRIRPDGSITSDAPVVGKYLKTASAVNSAGDIRVDEPIAKKSKRAGGFNFDAW